MSRARTKVNEWWETEFERKNFEHVPGRTRENALDFARAYGGTVYHVTRYRLAPLVDVRWDELQDGITRIIVRQGVVDRCIAAVVGCAWRVEHLEAATAACAERLRRLKARKRVLGHDD
jgi:hypothetical protein